MQIYSLVEVTELKNSRSLSFLSLGFEYIISLISGPVNGVRSIINQSVGVILDSPFQCWLSGIKSAWVIFYLLCFSELCGHAVFCQNANEIRSFCDMLNCILSYNTLPG